MRPIATDGVTLSASLFVTAVSREKMAEPIEMPFGMWTRVGPNNNVLDEVQIPTREGAILRAKRRPPWTCPIVDILTLTHQWAEPVR